MTARFATTASQQVSWRWEGEAFGNTGDQADLVQVNLRFPSQYYDQETGTNYNYFRGYDPPLGRYTQSDPIGLNGGMSNYSYALGNPLKYFDPDGLEPVPGGSDLGGGSSVRVDTKNLQPNQKVHAHFESPNGKGVVNIDGTPSHGKKSNLQNLNNRIKKFLRLQGFKLPSIIGLVPSIFEGICALNPSDPACAFVAPLNCPGTYH
jgi:RHS repeat-associated protein